MSRNSFSYELKGGVPDQLACDRPEVMGPPLAESQIDQKFIICFYCFLNHFGVHFGTVLTLILEPLGTQIDPSLVPNTIVSLIVVKKTNVHGSLLKKTMFLNDFGLQDGHQNAPRQAQDAPKRVPKAFFVYAQFCVRFGIVLDPILMQL